MGINIGYLEFSQIILMGVILNINFQISGPQGKIVLIW